MNLRIYIKGDKLSPQEYEWERTVPSKNKNDLLKNEITSPRMVEEILN